MSHDARDNRGEYAALTHFGLKALAVWVNIFQTEGGA
jgi:hypothetical protein